MTLPKQTESKPAEPKKKRVSATEDNPNDEIRVIAKTILKEARKRAKYEMECLTEMVLQEARIAARYARKRPFYIA